MDFSKVDQLRLWAKDLSLVTALLVVVLSWFNEIAFVWIIIRAIIAFSVMYGLTSGILFFFTKTAYPDLPEEFSEQNDSQGTLIDVSLGDDVADEGDPYSDLGQSGLNSYAGQVDPALASGVVSHQQQADILRRMGWKEE